LEGPGTGVDEAGCPSVRKKGALLGGATNNDEFCELCISKDEEAGLGASGDGTGAEYLRWSPGKEVERPRE